MSIKDKYEANAVKIEEQEDSHSRENSNENFSNQENSHYRESESNYTQVDSIKKVDDLIKNEQFLKKNYSILNAFFIAVIAISCFFTFKYATDSSVMVYQCRLADDMDGSSKLTKIENGRAIDYENLIKAEIRRFLRARYPKNSIEAKYMWEYAAKHSVGELKYEFESRLESINNTKNNFKLGNVTSIYPAVPSDEAIQIRKNGGSGWNISIPVRRVKRFGTTGDERIEAVAKLTIEKGEPRVDGSDSGLYVSDYYLSYVPDSISKKEIILRD